jgi:transcriptional regulator with XRE-family HTH domain
MSLNALLDRIMRLEAPAEGMPAVPPPELIGFFVRWTRGMRQWKQGTLAAFASVSLSTVERVERGERVSNEYLDRLAVALGYEKGYFTSPRLPLSGDEAAARLVKGFGELELVNVRPLRTHAQLRALANCQCFLPHRPGVPEVFDEEITGLVEWLDLASFVLSKETVILPHDEAPRRKLYSDILAHVRWLESHGIAVLAGVMNAPQRDLPEWKVAVLGFSLKATDPGAIKRRIILVDRRCVALEPSAQTASESEVK